MPTGREIHTVPPFQPPTLDRAGLEAMRAPPTAQTDEFDGDMPSSDDESAQTLVGAYPESSVTPGRAGSASVGYY